MQIYYLLSYFWFLLIQEFAIYGKLILYGKIKSVKFWTQVSYS